MTLLQLEYVLAVDTHRHFVRAAESCAITQPSLSMQLQKLEEELGVQIFDRRRQPVVPTKIGKQIIAQARTVVREARKIGELVTSEMQVLAGELRLGIIPTLAPYLLPRFAPDFLAEHPEVQLTVRELLTSQITEYLRHDALDVGLVALPLEENDLHEIPLFSEPFLAYLSPGHPLGVLPALRSEQLAQERLWLLSEGHCFREQALRVCQQQRDQTPTTFHYESGSLESLKRMVDQQSGLTLLPQLATDHLSEAERARIRPIENPTPARQIGMVVHQSFLKKRLIERLHQTIRHALPASLTSYTAPKIIRWK